MEVKDFSLGTMYKPSERNATFCISSTSTNNKLPLAHLYCLLRFPSTLNVPPLSLAQTLPKSLRDYDDD